MENRIEFLYNIPFKCKRIIKDKQVNVIIFDFYGLTQVGWMFFA